MCVILPSAVPTAPLNVMVVVEEQRELTVEWNQPEISNGIVQQYRVCILQNNSDC